MLPDFLNVILILSLLVGWVYVSITLENRRILKSSKERGEANICEFARSFDYRNTDTKVIRTVWNYISKEMLCVKGRPFHVRADDHLENDLQIDTEDLEDFLTDTSKKLNISIEQTEQNPYYDKVETVADLVHFIDHQKKLTAA